MLLRFAVTLVGIALSADLVARPADGAGSAAPTRTTFVDGWAAELLRARSEADAVAAARAVAVQAVGSSAARALRPRDAALLDDAVQAARRFEFGAALEAAEIFLEVPQPPPLALKAHDVAAAAALARRDAARTVTHALDARAIAAGDDATPMAVVRAAWAAEALVELNRDPDLAAALADEALAGAPTSHLAYGAVAARVRALLRSPTRRRDGIAEARAFLDRYPEYPRTDDVIVELAAAEVEASLPEPAARRLDALLWSRPLSTAAGRAERLRDALAEAGVPHVPRSIDAQFERGAALRRARHWSRAEDVLAAALASALASGAGARVANPIRFERALNAYDSGRFGDALAHLDAVDAAGHVPVSEYDRVTWRGRSLSRLGRREEAFDIQRTQALSAGVSATSDRVIELATDYGLWPQALALLEARNRRERDWHTWQSAFVTYMNGRFDRAAELFQAMQAGTSGDARARLVYWEARALARAGRTSAATDRWSTLAAEGAHRYYGLLAASRLAELEDAGDAGPALRPARVHWAGIAGPPSASLADVRAATDDAFWSAYPAALQADGALASFAERFGALFPAADLAAALADVGALEPARLEFREVLLEVRALEAAFAGGRRPTSRPLAVGGTRGAHVIDNRAIERGWWGVELQSARFPVPEGRGPRAALMRRQQAIYAQRAEISSAMRPVLRELEDVYFVRHAALDERLAPLTAEPRDARWHEVYPHAFATRLRPHVEATGINPYLLWGLMIVESDMNPDTISPADAYGLLQVIPKTGDLVALALGEPWFGVHQLLDPGESLRFGTWYLSALLEKFRGQELLALVAYNAGPHQVQRWLEWRGAGMDLDAFIETVPYDGARRYPQRIVRYMLLLRAADGVDGPLYLGNALDAGCEDNIYY